MKLTKAQRRFLEGLRTLNTAGETPNVIRVMDATRTNLSYGQTLYGYKICKQLIDQGLVGDLASGRVRALRITRDGLRAIEEV